MKIRRLVPTDWPAFRDLRLRALKADPLAFGSNFRREDAYLPERWRSWVEKGARGKDSATFVAEESDGRLVGMAGVFTDKEEYHVWGMWVSPELRGRGLGRELLDRVLYWAESTNPGREVLLDVNPEQSIAVRLYESRGFSRTGKTASLGHHEPAITQEMRRGPSPTSTGRPGRGKSDGPRG